MPMAMLGKVCTYCRYAQPLHLLHSSHANWLLPQLRRYSMHPFPCWCFAPRRACCLVDASAGISPELWSTAGKCCHILCESIFKCVNWKWIRNFKRSICQVGRSAGLCITEFSLGLCLQCAIHLASGLNCAKYLRYTSTEGCSLCAQMNRSYLAFSYFL